MCKLSVGKMIVFLIVDHQSCLQKWQYRWLYWHKRQVYRWLCWHKWQYRWLADIGGKFTAGFADTSGNTAGFADTGSKFATGVIAISVSLAKGVTTGVVDTGG